MRLSCFLAAFAYSIVFICICCCAVRYHPYEPSPPPSLLHLLFSPPHSAWSLRLRQRHACTQNFNGAMIPWTNALWEFIAAHLVKKFLSFYGTRKWIWISTNVPSLDHTPNHFIPVNTHSISLRFVLILSSHLCLALQSEAVHLAYAKTFAEIEDLNLFLMQDLRFSQRSLWRVLCFGI
jgi:hypothetical protein